MMEGTLTERLAFIGIMIGMVGLFVGMALQFGTSKAERYGKVATDPKTAKRIKIGYYCISLVVILPILGLLIGNIIEAVFH